MLRLHRLVICLALLVVEVACSPTSGALSDSDVATVKAQIDKYASAALARDFEAWGNTLAPDVVVLPPDSQPLNGREAFVNWAKNSRELTSFTATAEEVTGNGDLAYARGTYTYTATLADGSTMNEHGSFFEIHRHQPDGTWPYTWLEWHPDSQASPTASPK